MLPAPRARSEAVPRRELTAPLPPSWARATAWEGAPGGPNEGARARAQRGLAYRVPERELPLTHPAEAGAE